MQIEIDAKFVSEKCTDALHFLAKNFQPKILVTDMTKRIFRDDKVFVTDLGGKEVQFPTQVGAYAMGFPCTPWSLRGLGTGFGDDNAKPLQVGIVTILKTKPKTWLLECVEGMDVRRTAQSDDDQSDLGAVLQDLERQLGDAYLIVIYRRMHPTRFGYPMCRPRFYVSGCEKTMVSAATYSMQSAQAGATVRRTLKGHVHFALCLVPCLSLQDLRHRFDSSHRRDA